MGISPCPCPTSAVPSLTRSPAGPSGPGAPCRETTGVVRRWGWRPSMHGRHHGHRQRTHLITHLSCRSRLTLVSRRALGEQATEVQTRQVSRFQSKALHTCRALDKLGFEAKAGAGDLSFSQRAEDTHRWALHPPSLQGCQESPVGQVFHRLQVPPSQGHKALSRLRPAPSGGFQLPQCKGCLEPWCTSSPFLGCGLFPRSSPYPADPPPLYLPSVSHFFTADPQYLRDARARLVGTR